MKSDCECDGLHPIQQSTEFIIYTPHHTLACKMQCVKMLQCLDTFVHAACGKLLVREVGKLD